MFVVKQNRFNLPIVKLKEAIEANRFGQINIATVRVRWCRPQSYYDQASWRGTWRFDGGVIANQASHHIDMLQYLVGPVSRLSATAKTQLANIEVEDSLCAWLEFNSGAIGTIEATTTARPRNIEGSISILGEKGTVVIGGHAMNKIDTWEFIDPHPDDSSIHEFSQNPPDVYGYGHYQFYLSVSHSLNTSSKIFIDGFEGRKSLEIIHALYESVESSKAISLRFSPKHCKLGLK